MNEMHEYSRFQYIAHWLFRILRAVKRLQVIGEPHWTEKMNSAPLHNYTAYIQHCNHC